MGSTASESLLTFGEFGLGDFEDAVTGPLEVVRTEKTRGFDPAGIEQRGEFGHVLLAEPQGGEVKLFNVNRITCEGENCGDEIPQREPAIDNEVNGLPFPGETGESFGGRLELLGPKDTRDRGRFLIPSISFKVWQLGELLLDRDIVEVFSVEKFDGGKVEVGRVDVGAGLVWNVARHGKKVC